MRHLPHADTSARLTSVRAVSRGLGVLRGRARSGISLLEVMFSIGVVMIGLAGIAALLPVAGAQAKKGALADVAARRGADAVREFHVRGMANPSTWRWFDPSGAPGPPGFYQVTPTQLTAGLSFCIDPRFVAQFSDNAIRSSFPYDIHGTGTVLSMPRITLSPSLRSVSNAVMSKPQADLVFTSDDDLAFDLPGDRTLGPVQNFSVLPAAPLVPLKRNINGYISWMATVVPRLDRLGNPTDEYTLSVVVFSRRIIDVAFTDPKLATGERVVMASTFYGGQPAIGGGDLRLATQYLEDLQLRSGDWVLLSGAKARLDTLPPIDTLLPIQVHNWYRVANAGDEPFYDSANSVWVRDVTLTGPDWDWLSNIAGATQVTIVRGVVAVFEKTIRLETSSLWTH